MNLICCHKAFFISDLQLASYGIVYCILAMVTRLWERNIHFFQIFHISSQNRFYSFETKIQGQHQKIQFLYMSPSCHDLLFRNQEYWDLGAIHKSHHFLYFQGFMEKINIKKMNCICCLKAFFFNHLPLASYGICCLIKHSFFSDSRLVTYGIVVCILAMLAWLREIIFHRSLQNRFFFSRFCSFETKIQEQHRKIALFVYVTFFS